MHCHNQRANQNLKRKKVNSPVSQLRWSRQRDLAIAAKIDLHGDLPADRAVISQHHVEDGGRDGAFDVNGAGIARARIGKRGVNARFEFLNLLHFAVLSCLHDFGNGKGHNLKLVARRHDLEAVIAPVG